MMTRDSAESFAVESRRETGKNRGAGHLRVQIEKYHSPRSRHILFAWRIFRARRRHVLPSACSSLAETLKVSVPHSTSLMYSLRYVLPIICFMFLCTVASSEEADLNDDLMSNDSNSEWYIILTFSLMFGFFITLFGAMIAYFSVMEDLLMRSYINKGELIRGDVMSIEFARVGGRVGTCSNGQQFAEYTTFVEYTRQLSTNYTVRVRKQMKANEADFIRPLLPGSNSMLKIIKVKVGDEGNEHEEDSDEAHCDEAHCYQSYGDSVPVNACSKFPISRTIELYILPDYPKSGHARREVEKYCSCQYRLLTAMLIAFDFALAAFCARLAAEAIDDLEDAGQRRIGRCTIRIFFAFVVMQVPLIHCCMQRLFLDALREEYLESGEFVPIGRDDDSTLSSAGSDAYLNMTRCVSPRTMQMSPVEILNEA